MPAGHGRLVSMTAGAQSVATITAGDYQENSELADATVGGDTARSFVGGLKDGTLTVDLKFNEDDTGEAALVVGASVAIVYYPMGSTAGNAKFTGTQVVESRGVKSTLDDLVRKNVVLRGFLTEGTA